MHEFMTGGIVLGYLLSSLFFFRFWRDTGDRLFALFGVSFLILAVQRTALLFSHHNEPNSIFYIVRLVAFLIILFAILDKNRATKPAAQPLVDRSGGGQ
ncbi:MAG TPA: DUF5985 family protein [Planctomycetota bacterium]|nr:DUF5985 family protein [Planctomycetota bacterium]